MAQFGFPITSSIRWGRYYGDSVLKAKIPAAQNLPQALASPKQKDSQGIPFHPQDLRGRLQWKGFPIGHPEGNLLAGRQFRKRLIDPIVPLGLLQALQRRSPQVL